MFDGSIRFTVLTMLLVLYSSVSVAQEPVCVVSREGKMGYMDRTGRVVLPVPRVYDGGSDFHNGYASVNLGTDRDGFIDRGGKVVIEMDNALTYSFDDGLFQVMDKNNHYRCLDIDRKVIEPRWPGED